MNSDTVQQQTVYNSSDVAVLLKVKDSTLRKYTLLLEEAGYKFYKNGLGQRGFYDKDVIVLKKLLEIKSHPDMTLKRACNAVVSWVKDGDVSDVDTDDVTLPDRYDDRYRSEIEELKKIVGQQTELIQELSRKLDRQQKYLDERLERRDQVLMESLKKSMEERQQQFLEVSAAQEEQNKKGFWSRLLGR